MRPIEYITHLRLETAKSLLLDSPSLPISKIALRVGYTSPSYFSALFRAAEGHTPEEFRRGEGGSAATKKQVEAVTILKTNLTENGIE